MNNFFPPNATKSCQDFARCQSTGMEHHRATMSNVKPPIQRPCRCGILRLSVTIRSGCQNISLRLAKATEDHCNKWETRRGTRTTRKVQIVRALVLHTSAVLIPRDTVVRWRVEESNHPRSALSSILADTIPPRPFSFTS
jgi:hypothetical protein